MPVTVLNIPLSHTSFAAGIRRYTVSPFESWAAKIAALSGEVISSFGWAIGITSDINTLDLWELLVRGVILFGTSSVPDTAYIISAKICVYGLIKSDAVGWAPNVAVYGQSDTVIGETCYGHAGSVIFSNIISYAGWNTAGWNTFNLNTNGLASINKTGNTLFSFRNLNYDIAAIAPTWVRDSSADLVYSLATTANAESPFGTVFPYMQVTYTTDQVQKLELAFDQSILTHRDDLTWTDVTKYLMKLNIKRGRAHELDRIEAGTATFTLENSDGTWWRGNTTGTYYGTSGNVKPLTPVRLSVIYSGVTYRLFYGYTEGFPHRFRTAMGHGAICELRCVDIFKLLARFPLESNYIEQKSTNRFTSVLNSLNWSAGMRYADAGTVDVIAYNPATVAEREMALPHLQRVAEAEGGLIWCKGNGDIVFQDGVARQKSPYNTSQATFDGDGAISKFADIELVDDDTFMYNQAMISSATDAWDEQIVIDPDAQKTQGKQAYELSQTLIANEADAFDKGFVIINRYNDSELRPERLIIKPEASPADLYPKVLGYEISTRITVELDNTLNPAGLDKEYHIEGIEHEWAVDDQWITTWQLWRVNQIRIIKAEHDGHLVEATDDYDDTHDSAVGTPHNDEGELAIGQISLDSLGTEIFTIYRGFLQYDLSTILVTDVISEAWVLLYVNDTFDVDAEWDLTLVDPGGLVVPLVGADYNDLMDETTSYGERTIETTSITAGWVAIPLNVAGLAHLNLGGTTKFGLRSSKDISATAPGYLGEEYLRVDGVGSDNEPRLALKFDL